jgi:phosphopentomutase
VWQPLNEPVWGLIEVLKAHDRKSAFIYNWEQLRDLNRPGSLYLSHFIDTGYDLDGDEIIAQTAVQHFASAYIQQIAFTFVYFASVDVAGHVFRWMSDDYLKQVNRVDACVGQVLAALPDDTTVILQSDHGGHDYNHGEDIPEDMTIPWMIAGRGVKRNFQLSDPVSLLDTAPTLAQVIGVPAHELWQGRVVTSAFE